MKTVLIFSFIWLSISSFAQSFQKICKKPSYNIGASIIKTSDNNILIGSYSFSGNYGSLKIIKSNANGNILWIKTISSDSNTITNPQIFESYDSNYIIYGIRRGYNPTGVLILKTDTGGNVLWQKMIDTNGEGVKIIQTRDKGYAVLSSHYYSYSGPFSITRLDSNANFLWSKIYENGYLVVAAIGFNLVETSNGDFIATADLLGMTGYDYGIKLKTDSAGNAIWSMYFGQAEDNESVVPSGNGYLFSSGLGSGIKITKTDSSGNIIWANSYSTPASGLRMKVFKSDGHDGVYLAGTLSNAISFRAFVGHVDSSGILEIKSYMNNSNETILDLFYDSGKYFLTGFSNGTATDSNDVLYIVDSLDVTCAFNLDSITRDTINPTINIFLTNTLSNTIDTINDIVSVDTDTSFQELLTCSTITNIYEWNAIEKNIIIYPNPVEQEITVSFFDQREREIIIYNTLSVEVYRINSNSENVKINFEKFKSGLYYLICIDDRKIYMKKIIKTD